MLAVLPTAKSVTPPRPRKTGKVALRVELLEARETPAALYWNPLVAGNLLASNAANWRTGAFDGAVSVSAPTEFDDLFFVALPAPTPEPGGGTKESRNLTVITEGGEGGPPSGGGSGGTTTTPPATVSPNCTIDTASALDFHGVHLMAGYEGVVDFCASAFVGVLEVRSGKIVQNSEYFTTGGNELSVSQSMVWTGGDFNASDSMASGLSAESAKLTLLGGSVSVFDPGDGKTLKLGSYLTITDTTQSGTGIGGKLDLPSGTIEFTDEFAGMLATGGSLVQVKRDPAAADKVFIRGGKAIAPVTPQGDYDVLKLSKGAELQIQRKNPAIAGAVNVDLGDRVSVLLTDGGAFQVRQEVQVEVHGKLSGDEGVPSIRVADMKSGIRIENGSTIKTDYGIVMDGGSIVTLARFDGKGVALAQQGTATIVGDITIHRGWIKQNNNLGGGRAVGEDPGATDFANTHARLDIIGSLDWQEGGYVAWVNPETRFGDLILVYNHPTLYPHPATCRIATAVQFDVGYYPAGGALANLPVGTRISLVHCDVVGITPFEYVESAIDGLPTFIGASVNDAKLSTSKQGGVIYLEKK